MGKRTALIAGAGIGGLRPRSPCRRRSGTLVVRVEPAASVFIDDRAMGAAAELRLRLRAGRHRVRLETEWRFPWALELAPGATAELEVDLERGGFPR